jgi:hypothetical protein
MGLIDWRVRNARKAVLHEKLFYIQNSKIEIEGLKTTHNVGVGKLRYFFSNLDDRQPPQFRPCAVSLLPGQQAASLELQY